eukprot:1066532-Prymnesium_polylepis.1
MMLLLVYSSVRSRRSCVEEPAPMRVSWEWREGMDRHVAQRSSREHASDTATWDALTSARSHEKHSPRASSSPHTHQHLAQR